MKQDFERDGYYILRNVLTEAEVDALAKPIRAAFNRGDYDTYEEGAAYPLPGIHSMGPRVLEDNPEIADLSLAHPKIVAAVQELFGEPATLAQYWSIMRPPGAGLSDKPFVKGSGAHYDYKPWRSVGSYIKWMFAVIPFVDYTETAGPLAVSPGSHQKTSVLPSNGRVHQVDAAQVPTPMNIELIDPSLNKGDVVLMDGFLWHEARPNYGNSDRCGLYMKFHAKSSPPACGPTIYPTAVHDYLSEDVKHLVPYHRGDGQFAALRDAPVGGVDEARLLIEDCEDRLLLLGSEADGWRLPSCAAAEDESAGILDVCNVMGSVVKQIRTDLDLSLPWLSWLMDLSDQDENDTDGPENEEAKAEWRCRVYGHRLEISGVELTAETDPSYPHRWMSQEELKDAQSAGSLENGADILKWFHMWQNQEDEDGNPVTRSFGVPTTHVQYFKYNQNGNPEGTYRVGEFNEDGMPLAASA